MSEAPVRIGVVGLGFGVHLVRALGNVEGAVPAALADRHAHELEPLAGELNATPYRDGMQMIAEADLDAVILAVNPGSRGALMDTAIASGLHVLVEKPWASDPHQARAYADRCRGASQVVMSGFSFRYHPAFQRLLDVLEQDIGPPGTLSGRYVFDWRPEPTHWLWDRKRGGGFFNENSCHLLDAVTAIMGRPKRVFAEAVNLLEDPAEDAMTATVSFESGGIASLSLGCVGCSAFGDFPSLQVVAPRGEAHLRGRSHVWESLTWTHRGESSRHRFDHSPEQLGATRYDDAISHFVSCIRERSCPQTDVEAGVAAVDFAYALMRSAELVRPIDLPLQLPDSRLE